MKNYKTELLKSYVKEASRGNKSSLVLNKHIRSAVKSDSLYAFIPHIRCGFELETSNCNGKTYSEFEDRHRYVMKVLKANSRACAREYVYNKIFSVATHSLKDMPLMWKHVLDQCFYALSDYPEYLEMRPFIYELTTIVEGCRTLLSFHYSKTLVEVLEEKGCRLTKDPQEFLYKCCNYFDNYDFYDLPNEIQERAWESFPMYADARSSKRYFENGLGWHDKLECVRDATVTGPEIRTKGGLTVSEFLAASRSLNGSDIVVHKGCSFHIHLSLEGTPFPEYSEDFHAALWEGFLRQFHLLPKAVKKRWVARDGSYFKLGMDKDRYNAVAYRGNTWEFRLFGNVKKHKSHMKCLLIAIRSLKWAIRAQMGLEKRVLNPASKFSEYNGVIARSVMDYCLDTSASSFEGRVSESVRIHLMESLKAKGLSKV